MDPLLSFNALEDPDQYIYNRPSGRYQVQVPQPDGSRRSKTFSTKEEARTWRNAQMAALSTAAHSPVAIRHPQHEAILSAYSNWTGRSASTREIAVRFGMTPTEFSAYRKRYGITQDAPPFTPEQLAGKSVEELADQLLEQKAIEAERLAGEKETRRLRADADRWRMVNQRFFEPLIAAFEHLATHYEVPTISLDDHRVGNPIAVYASTADWHYGKYASPIETGNRYDRRTADDLLSSATRTLIRKVLRLGTPGRVILSIGGDDLHVDTYGATTTRGTPQDLDGTVGEVIEGYSRAIIRWIDQWRQIGVPVEIEVTPGNHNMVLAQAMALMVQAYYRETEQVSVNADPSPRKYKLVGDVLVCFTHGEKAKPETLLAHMAKEASILWSRSRRRVCFVQHLHHYETVDKGGVVFHRHPSLAGHDRWHVQNLYADATRGASVYVFDVDGAIHTLTANV
jgi:hypothetical protein